MPYVTTDDSVQLYYEDAGSGENVLFVHEFVNEQYVLATTGILVIQLDTIVCRYIGHGWIAYKLKNKGKAHRGA